MANLTVTDRAMERPSDPLRAIPDLDSEPGPRRSNPSRHRPARVSGWWSRALDPVRLVSDSSPWRRAIPALSVAGAYAGVAGTYIVVSSAAVSSAGADAEMWKGLAFVLLTALILGALLHEHRRR